LEVVGALQDGQLAQVRELADEFDQFLNGLLARAHLLQRDEAAVFQ